MQESELGLGLFGNTEVAWQQGKIGEPETHHLVYEAANVDHGEPWNDILADCYGRHKRFHSAAEILAHHTPWWAERPTPHICRQKE